MELRPEPTATGEPALTDGNSAYGVWDGATKVAAIEVSERDGWRHVGVGARLVQTRAEARALVDALEDLVHAGPAPIVVHLWDDLARHEARTIGWTGALRAPLQPPASSGSGGNGRGGLRSDEPRRRLAPPSSTEERTHAVDALLPAASVTRAYRVGRRMHTVKVKGADGRPALRVRMPDRDDLMPEPIAAAIDTTLAVKRRFGSAAAGVHGLSFDHGGAHYASGAVVGSAESATGTVFLSPNLACADDMAEQRQRAASAGGGTSAAVPPPFTALDGVVAHELWHNLDAAIQVSGTYAQFNRELGEALGVATLEHALRGGEREAPPEWRAARLRLAREVSAYATTSPREATAEMFKLWWCSNGEPAPIIARFGDLVEHYYPRADTGEG
jgi:hypothetical protein